MKTFFKAQFSSLFATGIDFSVTIACHELLHLHYMVSVFAGAMAGALGNFFINRYWSFKAEKQNVTNQGLKYLLVWFGSILLNMSGVYFLTEYSNMQYLLSKILTAIVVGIGFNYVLQKKYVFKLHETAKY